MKKQGKFVPDNESLSVLIPAYNEENNIVRVARLALADVKKFTNDFEIVIVDDGSFDNTGVIIDRLAKQNKHIRVVHHKVNQGLGKALQTGVKACRKDIIIYIEGDGQSLLKDQEKLLEKIKDADVVLGYRSSREDYSFFRKVLSYGYLILLLIFFNLKFKDVNWTQAYRRKIFDSINMKSQTPFFTTEVVIKSLRLGLRVTEASTLYHSRETGVTKLGNILTAYKMFKDMMKLRFGILN